MAKAFAFGYSIVLFCCCCITITALLLAAIPLPVSGLTIIASAPSAAADFCILLSITPSLVQAPPSAETNPITSYFFEGFSKSILTLSCATGGYLLPIRTVSPQTFNAELQLVKSITEEQKIHIFKVIIFLLILLSEFQVKNFAIPPVIWTR